MLGVSKDIDECAAGLTLQFTIFPFYKILSPSEAMRKNKQRFFISKYNPILNDFKLRSLLARASNYSSNYYCNYN